MTERDEDVKAQADARLEAALKALAKVYADHDIQGIAYAAVVINMGDQSLVRSNAIAPLQPQFLGEAYQIIEGARRHVRTVTDGLEEFADRHNPTKGPQVVPGPSTD